jgi:hypothetical protein
MGGIDLNNIPVTNFVFDFRTPEGYLPFGYTKQTIGMNVIKKLNKIHESFTGYYPPLESPSDFRLNRTAGFQTYIVEQTPNTKYCLTTEIRNTIKKNELYLVVLESLNVNNLYEYYGSDKFDLSDFFSPELLKLIKNNTNFKIVFMDYREGAYPHFESFLTKIDDFLNKHNINHKNKVIISTNNNFINDTINLRKHKYRISTYCNNNYLLTAGKFISELRVANNSITENDYEYSIQQDVNYNLKEKYFLMYNRNSDRIHRSYFLNKLYKENLIDKGYISFFENPHFENFVNNSNQYPQLNLEYEDILDIKNNYKNYYPLSIDNTDGEKVADFHNFLSRKDEYENSYFTIVSETNAESKYCFITEKTTKPIMNLHPFIIMGNPKILSVLKSYGFQTFNKWWDESYDDEVDFKTRTQMILNIVKSLCSKSKEEMTLMIKEMESILIHNKKVLHKLYTTKQYQTEFFYNVTNKSLI